MKHPLWERLPNEHRSRVDELIADDRKLLAIVAIRDTLDEPRPGIYECMDLLAERYAELDQPWFRPSAPLDIDVLARHVSPSSPSVTSPSSDRTRARIAGWRQTPLHRRSQRIEYVQSGCALMDGNMDASSVQIGFICEFVDNRLACHFPPLESGINEISVEGNKVTVTLQVPIVSTLDGFCEAVHRRAARGAASYFPTQKLDRILHRKDSFQSMGRSKSGGVG
jgi:hypothetical protein